jgi:hypothetical protein
MADFTYSLANKKLCITSSGKCWNAVSGPHGAGALPVGTYRVERNKITPYTASIAASYRDSTGRGFFLPIKPTFTTPRDGFGIHPDGGVPGTLGCIGLTAADTESFFEAIRSMARGDYTLEVM